jgi:hypothetical protein
MHTLHTRDTHREGRGREREVEREREREISAREIAP